MGPVWNSTSLLGENRYRGKDRAEIIAHNVGWSDFLRFSKTGNFHFKQLNILKLDLNITVLDSYVVVVVGVMLRILLCVCVQEKEFTGVESTRAWRYPTIRHRWEAGNRRRTHPVFA